MLHHRLGTEGRQWLRLVLLDGGYDTVESFPRLSGLDACLLHARYRRKPLANIDGQFLPLPSVVITPNNPKNLVTITPLQTPGLRTRFR